MAKKFVFVCAGLFLLAITYHAGARRASAETSTPVPSEVAVLSGVIPSGGTIPLPTYEDGTQALESDCHWTVSVSSTTTEAGGQLFAYTNGRVVTCGTNNRGADANYLIIAVRSADQPMPVSAATWGQVKSTYRK